VASATLEGTGDGDGPLGTATRVRAGVFGQADRFWNVVGFCAFACPADALSLSSLILSETLPGFAAPTGMLNDPERD